MISRVPRRLLILGLVCVLGVTAVATAAGAHSAPAAKAKTVTVTLKNFMFNPMTETIQPGTTVKWIWEDGPGGTHNITPLHKKGGLLFKGASDRHKGTYTVKFTKPGTYYYECSIHPLTMQAKIIVK